MHPSATVHVGRANHFIVNNPINSANLANQGVVISACKALTGRNNKTFSKGSTAGISHDTTCVTHCITGGIITTNFYSHYRISVTCTVDNVCPRTIRVRAFYSRRVSQGLVSRTITGAFSFTINSVVHSLSLQHPRFHGATICNRFNQRSRNFT